MDNIFQLPFPLPPTEVFEILVQTEQLRIERIISQGKPLLPTTGMTRNRMSG